MVAREVILTVTGLIAWLVQAPAWSGAAELLWFEDQIQPLLENRCGKCHGVSGRKGDLELLSMAGVRRGGESGEPLIGPTLDESLLWMTIQSGDMPPPDQPDLTESEQQLIKAWIMQGAPARQASEVDAPKLNQHAVLPIVLLRCTVCHGPQRQDGKLDLRTCETMLVGGQSGPALVPGDPDGSLMIQRIESEACPPRELLLKFFVRRPSTSEVATLRTWIAEGAPTEEIAADIATTEPDPLVTDEDRKHWAFQPPQPSPQPLQLDDFIHKKLREHGLDFSPEADRATLIRRAYLDLIGLPPTIEQWQAWKHSRDADWYSQMVEHLLASPHYGERWGRYWLDLAGYADSEGGTSADPLRAVAWKYRDYVISAFNEDKPYDRFLVEQLAGDELVDYQRAETITQEMVDNLIATGFLRMGIDETGSRTMNFVPERLKVISDAITVVSAGLMGLTLECARCHSHKYDPIPHRDYYRFKAIFQGALDEHDWYSYQKRSLSVATEEHRQQVAEVNPAFETQIKKLESLQTSLTLQLQLELLQHHYPQQSENDNAATLKALKVADNNRTLPQKMLVERLQSVEVLDDASQPEAVRQTRAEIQKVQRQIDQIRRKMVPALAIRALWDQGRPSPTYILRRGEHDKPGALVGPGVPSVLTDGQTPFAIKSPFPLPAESSSQAKSTKAATLPTGRRLAFAKWLTSADHPLTARVMVNRLWYHHFGTGLAKDLDNFGRMGEPPSHPELLDWLAVQFVKQGWSMKHMHRLMMNSRTYRQSSRISAESAQRDSQGRLLSRMPLRRLDAEALRDSLLTIAGRLDPCGGGLPDTVTVDRYGLVSVNPTDGGGWRRSVYLQYRRTEIPTFMDTFDYPQMGPNCIGRNVSIVSPQSLFMMNNEHVHELATAFAQRVLDATHDTADPWTSRIEASYRLALSRDPKPKEISLGVEALRELMSAWGDDELKALSSYAHTLLNSGAFLYVD
jgi:hypothetical protein